MDDVTLPNLSKPQEVADTMRMSLKTVHEYADKGLWPDRSVYRVGNVLRFDLGLIIEGCKVDMEEQRRNTSGPHRPKAPSSSAPRRKRAKRAPSTEETLEQLRNL